MSTNDLINGLFEVGGTLVTLLNVRQLVRDRRISGVHWAPTLFFGCWGLWNLHFYSALGQWVSFWAAGALAASNLAWIALLAWFSWGGRARRCA